MKHTIKRITSLALSIALLGTGTIITKTAVPEFDTAISADAANVYGQRYVVKASPYLNVRSGPSINCGVIGRINNHTTIYVYGFYNGWASVSTSGDAWVNAAYIF